MSKPISVSSVFLNFANPVILSVSETSVPSTPPPRLVVEIKEPALECELNVTAP